MKVMKVILLSGLLTVATGALAQDAIPGGTVLPVRLNSTLSLKTQPGKTITGRIMQDVPLSNGKTIHEGARVVGHVTTVTATDKATSARISFTFDKVVTSKQTVQITTNLRAMASFVEVEEAQIPELGPDRGTPENAWTTNQVGGDVVYRGGGPVMEGSKIIGKPVYNGVLGRVYREDGAECRGAIDANDLPQALWVFSADACGLYGFPDVAMAHAGRTNPIGEIVLTSNADRLTIQSGSGMLLRVM